MGGDGSSFLTQYQYIMASMKVLEHLNNEEMEGKEAIIDAFIKSVAAGLPSQSQHKQLSQSSKPSTDNNAFDEIRPYPELESLHSSSHVNKQD